MAIPDPPARSLLLIVSGPAGSGKTTLCDRLTAAHSNIRRVVTTTTREPRAGEVEGQDYYFIDHARFEQQIKEGAFYEYARVHGRYYGTYRSEIDRQLDLGHDLLLNIDYQGAATFRQQALQHPLLKNALVTIFILPPSLQELEQRLILRGSDSPGEIQRRLHNAQAEMDSWSSYHYCLRSSSREADFSRLNSIYIAEKMRIVVSA